jgi:hypothetical protein
MNQHIETWIDAYLDGELNEKQIVKFEKHLETCSQCLELINEREKLSSLLQMVQLPDTFKNTEQFIQDINLLLPREQTRGFKKPRMGGLWLMGSIGLLILLTFTQVVNLISNLLLLVPGVDSLVDQAASLPGLVQTTVPWVQLFFEQWFTFSGWGFVYGSLTFTSIALTGLLMLIYLSWLVLGWSNQFSQQKQQTFFNQ